VSENGFHPIPALKNHASVGMHRMEKAMEFIANSGSMQGNVAGPWRLSQSRDLLEEHILSLDRRFLIWTSRHHIARWSDFAGSPRRWTTKQGKSRKYHPSSQRTPAIMVPTWQSWLWKSIFGVFSEQLVLFLCVFSWYGRILMICSIVGAMRMRKQSHRRLFLRWSRQWVGPRLSAHVISLWPITRAEKLT